MYMASPRVPCFYDEKMRSLAEAEEEVAKRASDEPVRRALKKVTRLWDIFLPITAASPIRIPGGRLALNPQYEGQGFATASVSALFTYLFTQKEPDACMPMWKTIICRRKNSVPVCICDRKAALRSLSRSQMNRAKNGTTLRLSMRCLKEWQARAEVAMSPGSALAQRSGFLGDK
jgi:hypothetical protein